MVKRKAGTNKVTKKLKKVPQGAQAEFEAAELSKLQQQYATKLPDTPNAPEATPKVRSPESSNAGNAPLSSRENVQGASKRRNSGKRLLKRRHSGTKHLASGAGIVESGSVNVPPVRRFSPVYDKPALNTQATKVYDGAEMFAGNNLKSFDNIPTTSNNITVAMVKEEHNAKPKGTSNEVEPTATTNEATTSNTVVTNLVAADVENIVNNSGVVGGGGSVPTAEELQNSLTPLVVPIVEPISTAPSTSNNNSSKKGVNALPISFLIKLFITNIEHF